MKLEKQSNVIIIIDDIEINRDMLADIFKDEYTILEAENGKEGLELILNNLDSIAAILLDLMMPVMNGFEVLAQLKEKSIISKVPIIMITGEDSIEYEQQCYEYSIVDYIRKPFHPRIVRRMVENVIELYRYQAKLEMLVKERTKTVEEQNETLKRQSEKLHKMNDMMIETISNVVEFRNLESGQHVKRVRKFTRCLAEEVMARYPEYGLEADKLDVIEQAAAMHDIGKIVIPDAILLKPGKLTFEEFEIMKTHTTRGAEMIASIVQLEDEDYYNYCYQISKYHHERFDGRGYPDKLVGDEIPIAAQIVSIADVYDALISKRVYKEAYGKDSAYHMIMNGECGVFSPKLLIVFEAVKDKFEALAKEYSEEE